MGAERGITAPASARPRLEQRDATDPRQQHEDEERRHERHPLPADERRPGEQGDADSRARSRPDSSDGASGPRGPVVMNRSRFAGSARKACFWRSATTSSAEAGEPDEDAERIERPERWARGRADRRDRAARRERYPQTLQHEGHQETPEIELDRVEAGVAARPPGCARTGRSRGGSPRPRSARRAATRVEVRARRARAPGRRRRDRSALPVRS